MQIHSLQNTSLETLAETFNKAFESYFVPIKLDAKLLADKIKSENILLEHSVGVIINNKLAGFILIAIDAKNSTAYNAGTGTIPEFRGQRLTEKMYSYLLPKLDKIEIQNHLLEVICQNQKALKIYEGLGYSVTRKVICYKGKISESKKSQYKIETIQLPNETEIKQFRNHKPTYQNSLFCIKNNLTKHTTLGAFDNEKLIGYIVFDKNTLRIKQFGVNPNFRNKGIGHQLFFEVQNQNPDAVIVIINVDESDSETNNFLQSIGLNNFIEQYEMKLNTN
ncbi:MAG: GNAT family N-acetyltransferase [Flavobacterium sp.]|uniref:GNAT family N-acetyltransferase n=1 Tax=Flavobacterium sp. TaxID=239 RepID=UPI0032639D23